MKQNDTATPVKDVIAEDRIKWGTIVQGLILASILGTVTMAYAFGNHLAMEGAEFKDGVITGINDINSTLNEMRKDITNINIGVRVNDTRLNNHEARLSSIEGEIRK